MADHGRHAYVRNHYDAVRNTTQKDRAQGPLFRMKQRHNAVKKDLLERYARNAGALLDVCCGRGGDVHKWIRCGIRQVVGVDISAVELQEARARYDACDSSTVCVFECCDVAHRTWETATYDVVSAMFCMHYFCATEDVLRSVLQGISQCLVPGGVFLGCMPDGARIEAYVLSRAASPYLSIQPLASFYQPGPFGREYLFALEDTVTAASDASAGSLEYLVDVDAFVRVAAECGLELVEKTPMVDGRTTRYQGNEVSALFLAFAFKKI